MLANPIFHELLKLFRLLNEKACFRLRRDIGHVVVDLVPVSATEFEVGGERNH